LLIAASILAARKLAQYDSGARVPATVSAIADAVRWAERIMEEIDRRHPVKREDDLAASRSPRGEGAVVKDRLNVRREHNSL
jgi:hypothetical protein